MSLFGSMIGSSARAYELEANLRALARETYIKTRIRRPHMPHPDSDEGQRKIDRLFDICWAAVKP